MEAFLFIMNSIMVVLSIYMALRDERRPRSRPATSLFRFRQDAAEDAANPYIQEATQARQRRR